MHQLPITAGWHKAVWNREVCLTPTHDWKWELNLRPFDFASNILSIWPRATTNTYEYENLGAHYSKHRPYQDHSVLKILVKLSVCAVFA